MEADIRVTLHGGYPKTRRDFTAIGVWGQYIYVEPTREVIIIKTITDPDFDNSDLEGIGSFRAIPRSVAGNGTH